MSVYPALQGDWIVIYLCSAAYNPSATTRLPGRHNSKARSASVTRASHWPPHRHHPPQFGLRA